MQPVRPAIPILTYHQVEAPPPRGTPYRILVVSPGSLSGQWQDELRDKFGLEFAVFSRELQELTPNGNAFTQTDRVIAGQLVYP